MTGTNITTKRSARLALTVFAVAFLLQGLSNGYFFYFFSAAVIVIGVVAGVIAAAAATLTGWLLATRVLELEYVPQLSVVIISILVSIVLVWAVSRSGVRSALQAPPQATLKAP